MPTQTGGSAPSDRLHNEALKRRERKGQKRDKGSLLPFTCSGIGPVNVSFIHSRSGVKMKARGTRTQIIPADFQDTQASGFILNRS